jgi:DNA-binding CsgD family transcriptional regulator
MRLDLLTENDRRHVLDVAWMLCGIRIDEDLTSAVLEVANSYIGADELGFNEMNLIKQQLYLQCYNQRSTGGIRERLLVVMNEHPAVIQINRTRSLTPLRISDFMPYREFAETRTFDILFRSLGVRHQLNIPLHIDATARSGAAYSLNRAGLDFSDRDVQRAEALQSVVTALHAAIRARRPTAEQLEQAQQRSQLSNRELEILTLSAAGLTAAAIGRSLRISPRTVHKHLENSFRKLDVRDRMAAVSMCRRLGLLP